MGPETRNNKQKIDLIIENLAKIIQSNVLDEVADARIFRETYFKRDSVCYSGINRK